MATPSEDGILAIIDDCFANEHPAFRLGRKDDCAIFKPGKELVCSSDFFLEDAHFRRSYFKPADIGHKALAVNISDLAACAALPLGFSLCLALPDNMVRAWLREFFLGMASLAGAYDMLLCGGDISRSDKIQICITAYGEKPAKGNLLRRRRAKDGDCVFVVGNIGLARIGLLEMEKFGGKYCRKNWPKAFMAHLRPQPLVEAALKLGEYAASHDARIGLMDVSDGISRDLPRLLGPALGAELDFSQDKLPFEVIEHAVKNSQNPFLSALAGGEDYALLGTCPETALPDLQALAPGLWKLGLVNATGCIKWAGQDLLAGFDHFEPGGL